MIVRKLRLLLAMEEGESYFLITSRNACVISEGSSVGWQDEQVKSVEI
jgi:hypothetical protein